jgi:hypothetical protein
MLIVFISCADATKKPSRSLRRNHRLSEVGNFRHVNFGSRLCAPKGIRLEKRRKTMFVELRSYLDPQLPQEKQVCSV